MANDRVFDVVEEVAMVDSVDQALEVGNCPLKPG